MIIEVICRIAHQVNKAYCEEIGDVAYSDWEDAPEEYKESMRNGVAQALKADFDTEELHQKWMEDRIAKGWVYGPEKDFEKKEHPCLVPYSEIPKEQRVKDSLFKAVVDTFK